MRTPRLLVIAGLAVSALALNANRASGTPINLVVDGSFEDLTPGNYYYLNTTLGAWTFDTPSYSAGVYLANQFSFANVTDGTRALDLGMGSYSSGNSVSQTISTIAGQTYRLEFDWGSEYGWGTYGQVQIGSTSALLIDSADVTSTWLQHHAVIDFVASGNDLLKFIDLTTAANAPGPDSLIAGLSIDKVSIVEAHGVPDSGGTLFLLLSGLGVLGLGRRFLTQ